MSVDLVMRHITDNYPLSSMDNCPLARRQPHKYLIIMENKFRKAFLRHLSETNLKVTDVAKGARVSKDQLNKLKQGKSQSINVDAAVLVARYFGETVNEFIGEERPALHSSLIQKLGMLTEREQRVLVASLNALSAERPEADPTPNQDEQ